jgi:hypothetical protein
MADRSITTGVKPRKPPLLAAPWFRVTVPIFLGILANVFAGAYIFEITRTSNNQPFLAWTETHHSVGFWCLLGVAIVAGIYVRRTLAYERQREEDISRFRDKDYILSILYEAQTRARVAEIEGGKSYTFAELEQMVFGKEPGR